MMASPAPALARQCRLLIVATHPIQYQAPLFRALARRTDVDVTVVFAHRPSAQDLGEGFGVDFQWDIDLTSGFRHRWMRNRSRQPGLNTFFGCHTPDIGEVIQTEAPDALLVMGWNKRSYVQAIAAARRLHVPVIVRGDTQLITQRSAFKRAIKACLYPWWVRRFAVCLAVGERSVEYFAHYGAPRIVGCPHFVDNERFAAASASARGNRDALRIEFGCSTGAFLFLFAGKLTAGKRPLDAIDALASCRAAGIDAELLVVGDGALRGACERRARERDVPVRFAGFVNQSRMAAVYGVADALVLPSSSETWGLVVNEAMACGVPAIVSHEAGCSADLAGDPCVSTFSSGDVGALSDRMIALARFPDRARHLREAARRVAGRFSVESAVDGILEGLRLAGVYPS